MTTHTTAPVSTPKPAARTAGRRSRRSALRGRGAQGWLYAMPTAVFVGLFFIVPILLVVQMSVSDWPLLAGNRGPNFPENFQDVVANQFFWPSIVFTLKYTVIATVLLLGLGLGLALLVQESHALEGVPAHRVPRAQRARAGLGLAAVLRALLAPVRPVRPFLEKLGLVDEPISFLGTPDRGAVVDGLPHRLALRRVLHAAAARGAAGHPRRGVRGRPHRRRQPSQIFREHHAAAAAPLARSARSCASPARCWRSTSSTS